MTCYQILDLVISSLAAVGTIGAVVVALYLANRRRKVDLRVSVHKSLCFGGAQQKAEVISFRIINRSDFPVQIDSIGWMFPQPQRCLCAMINSELHVNELQRFVLPTVLHSGAATPSFYIPWEEFEESLHYLASTDSDGEFHREAKNRSVKFYVSAPRADENLAFDIGDEVMDAFVKAASDG